LIPALPSLSLSVRHLRGPWDYVTLWHPLTGWWSVGASTKAQPARNVRFVSLRGDRPRR
jgi:hypothetical protein